MDVGSCFVLMKLKLNTIYAPHRRRRCRRTKSFACPLNVMASQASKYDLSRPGACGLDLLDWLHWTYVDLNPTGSRVGLNSALPSYIGDQCPESEATLLAYSEPASPLWPERVCCCWRAFHYCSIGRGVPRYIFKSSQTCRYLLVLL